MIDLQQLQPEIERFEISIAALRDALHIERTRDRYQEMAQRAQEPDFWDNPERAQQLQREMGAMEKRIERFRTLEANYEDLLTMTMLAQEEEDGQELAEDIAASYESLKADYESLRLESLLGGEYDANNAILTLHAGAGGTEAMDWAGMLLRMYTRWAEDHGYGLEMLDVQDGEDAGLKSATFQVNGDNAYGYLRSEMGVHRLVRVSPFDSSGRRHTSFASLEVMPELDDTIEIEIKPDDLKMDVFRASGAGGQHVNKTSSAVRLTHLPTGIVVSCQAERSQFQNRDKAMEMLKAKLFARARALQKDKIEDLKGEQLDIAWGSQIRSYVFMPYTMVKDHRTLHEESDVEAVMDGKLDPFINAFLSDPELNEEGMA